MGMILFALTLLCTIDMALNLRALEVNVAFSVEMLNTFVNFSMVIALTFAHYYFSEQITTDLLAIGEILYNSTWYELPVKQQRLIALPIQRAQREIRLRSLELFDCSLPVFSSVRQITLQLNQIANSANET